MKATNIKWEHDRNGLLPTEITIPEGMSDEDEISDYLSDLTGYCHEGFSLVGEMTIEIYQIDIKKDKDNVIFENLKHLQLLQGTEKINKDLYRNVFAGVVPCTSLEEVYQMFNINPPEDYRHRTMSVSDIVKVIKTENENIESGSYFCDSIGFVKID